LQKTIVVDYSRCTGCRYCETACSAQHEGEVNPSLARIKVVRSEMDGLMAPTLCQQCVDAPCVTICPVLALSREDDGLGRVVVDYGLCIGCKMCVVACPFGDMKYDDRRKRVIKCDLCDGEPACVKVCSTDAILFVDASDVNLAKKHNMVLKLSEFARRYP
jgi:carbon-monoxide dehydrogenase iron sulfur subunit